MFHKVLGIKKIYAWQVAYHEFLSNNFGLAVARNVSGEIFSVSETFGYQIFYA